MKSQNFNNQSSRIILKIINSENARKILKSTSERSMSAAQISQRCNIPLTKTYRWLKKLQNMKFIQGSGTISKQGRKVTSYKSLVKTIIFNPNHDDKSIVQVLGVGNTLTCSKCRSKKCTLDYDLKTNLWSYSCIDCHLSLVQTNQKKLKEEQQKVFLLEELDTERALREEQQKVLLLEALIKKN